MSIEVLDRSIAEVEAEISVCADLVERLALRKKEEHLREKQLILLRSKHGITSKRFSRVVTTIHILITLL